MPTSTHSVCPKPLWLLIALPHLLCAQTTVTLATLPNPSIFGAPVTLTATVSNAAPTGRVTFFDGVNILGAKPVTSGAASISTILLSAGSRKLTALYHDDAHSIVGASNVVLQTVKANAGNALTAQTPIALATVPSNAAVGDFNGDGRADFAFASPSNVPSWWQVDLGAAAGIGSIVIWNRTDCCGDRLSDYWVFVSSTPFGELDTPATLGNRAGTFSSHQTAAPNPSTTIAVNGATGRYIRVQLSNPNYLSLAEVQVFGTGAQAATNLALGKVATQSSTYPNIGNTAAASAVDGNTNGDFFKGSVSTTDISSGSIVTVVLGRGDGTFQAPVISAAGVSGSVAVGDFNGDGIADLAVGGTNFVVGGDIGLPGALVASLSILLGKGDGTFVPAKNYAFGSFDAGGPLVVGDFNGDGKPDILMDGFGFGHFTTATKLILLTGNGDGTFATPVEYPPALISGSAAPGPYPFAVADFNGDGIPDVVSDGYVLLGNGDGTHQPSTAVVGNTIGSISYVTGDFNGDGKPDLAVGGTTFFSGIVTLSTSIFLGNGDGSFQPYVPYPLGAAVTTGDFNGDGIPDLVVTDNSGNLSGILLGNGDGIFRRGFSIPSGAPLAIADFNGDGLADVLTANPSGVTVLLGTTQSSNLAQGKIASQSSTYPIASAAASSAVDGNTDGNFYDGSVTATNLDPNPWWQVDLGASASVTSIVIWNRTDCCGSRLSDYRVFISDTPFLATDTPATLQNRVGTFVSHQTTAPNPSTTIPFTAQGRYVRVQLSTANYLSLSEVQVFGSGGGPPPSNLSQGKIATQSSTYPIASAAASSAVDGNTDGNFYDGSVTATNLDPNPWWHVDLGASASVSSIMIWNRTDCCGSRLSDYWVFISDTPFLATDTPVTLQNRVGTFVSHQTAAPNPSTTIPFNAQGRYVRVQLSSPNYLSLAEVQVFGQ